MVAIFQSAVIYSRLPNTLNSSAVVNPPSDHFALLSDFGLINNSDFTENTYVTEQRRVEMVDVGAEEQRGESQQGGWEQEGGTTVKHSAG